jgi:hypothetical protein
MDVLIYVFLISALVGGKCSASCPGSFTTTERVTGTHWTWSWVGPTASLEDVEKRKFLTLPRLKLWPVFQPRASCYTDCAIPAPLKVINIKHTKASQQLPMESTVTKLSWFCLLVLVSWFLMVVFWDMTLHSLVVFTWRWMQWNNGTHLPDNMVF